MRAANGDHRQARHHFLKGFNAKFFEKYLEQCVHRAQKDTVELPLDDVNVAEFVEVPTDHVEKAQRHERKSVEEQDFIKRPALKFRNLREEHEHEAESNDRGRHRREESDEEVGLVGQAHFDVLREVEGEEAEVASHLSNGGKWSVARRLHSLTPNFEPRTSNLEL